MMNSQFTKIFLFFCLLTPAFAQQEPLQPARNPVSMAENSQEFINHDPDWDYVFASHTFHEITMYYPMRVIRTRQFKYMLNLAHQLPYPFASDLYEAPTWKAAIKHGENGTYGKRRVGDSIQRPRHELYNMEADSDEILNLAENPEFARTLKNLQDRLKAFQASTGDPWVVKYKYE